MMRKRSLYFCSRSFSSFCRTWGISSTITIAGFSIYCFQSGQAIPVHTTCGDVNSPSCITSQSQIWKQYILEKIDLSSTRDMEQADCSTFGLVPSSDGLG